MKLNNTLETLKHYSGDTAKVIGQKNTEDEYRKVSKKALERLLELDGLIFYGMHNLNKNQDVIEIVSDAANDTNSWSYTIYDSCSKQDRKNKVFDHILSEKN